MKGIKIYGIANCDVIKKTKAWFEKQHIQYTFHDYKILGISSDQLKQWIAKAGLETVMNKRSTTWRDLPADLQTKAKTEKEAIRIMQDHNSIIKRPVIEFDGKVIVGYDEPVFEKIFSQKSNHQLKQ